jgi:hypothetical protein
MGGEGWELGKGTNYSCIWISEGNEGKCEEVREFCEDITSYITCKFPGAAISQDGKSILCMWLEDVNKESSEAKGSCLSEV